MELRRRMLAGFLMGMALAVLPLSAQQSSLGIFEDQADIGAVRIPGKVLFDKSAGTYTITGSGENMWFATDAFHFVWKKLRGDFRLAADIAFVGEGKNPHRKAVLIVRQTLHEDSAYVDLAIHGDGLTSMQFRGQKGANTMELQFGRPAPKRVEIVREGNLVYVRVDGQEMRAGTRPLRMENFLRGDVYVGLGVCSHETAVAETAVFSNVELATPAAQGGQ